MERAGVHVLERDLDGLDVAINAQSAVVFWSDVQLEGIGKFDCVFQRQDAIIDLVRPSNIPAVCGDLSGAHESYESWHQALCIHYAYIIEFVCKRSHCSWEELSHSVNAAVAGIDARLEHMNVYAWLGIFHGMR
jgi:hypothetical protein